MSQDSMMGLALMELSVRGGRQVSSKEVYNCLIIIRGCADEEEWMYKETIEAEVRRLLGRCDGGATCEAS